MEYDSEFTVQPPKCVPPRETQIRGLYKHCGFPAGRSKFLAGWSRFLAGQSQFRQGGLDFWQGGLDFWQGGFDFWQGGVDFWKVGLDLQQGCLDLQQGGQPALEPGYAIRDMIIAVGTGNMITNPLSWSSKSVFEPTDKNKGFKSRSSLE